VYKGKAEPMLVSLSDSYSEDNSISLGDSRPSSLSQIRYSLVVILELNGVSEVQYKDVMMIDDGKYQ